MERREPVSIDEIDLRELFQRLWKRRWAITGVTAAAVLLAAALSLYVLTPIYESRTLIQLSEHSAPAYATLQSAAKSITSLTFLEPLARANGIPESDRNLESFVKVEPIRDTRMVQIRVRYGDRERLRGFTQAIVEEVVRRGSQRVAEKRRATERLLESTNAQLAEVDRTLRLSRQALLRLERQRSTGGTEVGFARGIILNSVSISAGLYGALVRAQRDLSLELLELDPPTIIQSPYIPPKPVSPRPLLNSILALLLGLVAGTIWVLSADYLRGQGAVPAALQPTQFAPEPPRREAL